MCGVRAATGARDAGEVASHSRAATVSSTDAGHSCSGASRESSASTAAPEPAARHRHGRSRDCRLPMVQPPPCRESTTGSAVAVGWFSRAGRSPTVRSMSRSIAGPGVRDRALCVMPARIAGTSRSADARPGCATNAASWESANGPDTLVTVGGTTTSVDNGHEPRPAVSVSDGLTVRGGCK